MNLREDSTTAGVQGYRTPRAFKLSKLDPSSLEEAIASTREDITMLREQLKLLKHSYNRTKKESRIKTMIKELLKEI